MSRPAKSVYRPKPQTNMDQWETAAEASLDVNLRLVISRSKDNYYAKFIVREYKCTHRTTKIPIRPEVQDALREKRGCIIQHEKGKYSIVVSDTKGVQLEYIPTVGEQRSIFITSTALNRLNENLGLFDFFMRDDEPLDKTVARFIHLIEQGDKYEQMCRMLEEKTGLTIEWKRDQVDDPNKMPEAGEYDMEALTYLKSFFSI